MDPGWVESLAWVLGPELAKRAPLVTVRWPGGLQRVGSSIRAS
jgi:hypothetical protein